MVVSIAASRTAPLSWDTNYYLWYVMRQSLVRPLADPCCQALAFAAICHDSCLWLASYGHVNSPFLQMATVVASIGLQANLLGSVLLAWGDGALGRFSSRLASAAIAVGIASPALSFICLLSATQPTMAIAAGTSGALMLVICMLVLFFEGAR
jgi:hypothetical protein